MKNILIYYPSNKRTIAMESMIYCFRQRNYEVLLLTTCEKGELHSELERNNIKTYTHSVATRNRLVYYIRQMLYLIRFCRKHNINYIHSHLQHANIIAVFSRFFIKAKLIVFRHHFQYIDKNHPEITINKTEKLFDKIINYLAPEIVVPSSGVYNSILKTETINIKKLHIIPYIYDFSKYNIPNLQEVQKIKQDFPCKLRLIMVSRLIKLKRHLLVFKIIRELVAEGYDIKMLVLDDGPEKENLRQFIDTNNLSDCIIMLGFRKDFINYMAACDLLIQPSLTDASNSVAKEMALLEKAVAVSKNVGDYDEYIHNGENGYSIPITNSEQYIKAIIIEAYTKPETLHKMGAALKKQILTKFDISNSDNIIAQYEKLMSMA